MAGVDPLRLGLSGLLAAQRGLATTGQNIANVGTEGYSRQRVQQLASVSGIDSGLSPGNGVTISDVRRLGNAFLTRQISRMTAEQGQASSQAELSSRLDGLLSDPDTGLSASFNRFSEALSGVARDPSSLPLRESLLEQGGQLAARFRALDGELLALDEEVGQRLGESVNTINSLTAQIARLNNDISVANARGSSFNNLLDQRDEAVRALSGQIGVNTLARDDGSLDVLTQAGESLVSGVSSRQFGVQTDPLQPGRLVVTNTRGNISDTPQAGGVLGGLQAWRSSVLDPAQARLGRLAVGLSDSINQQHRLGQDLNGKFGGAFFTELPPSVNADVSNSGGALSASISSLADLQASDYSLRSDNGANLYTLTRLADGQTFSIDSGGASDFTVTGIDGLDLTISAGAAQGDRFLLKAVSGAASAFGMALQDSASIAAASPIVTETGTSVAPNTGTLTVESLQTLGTGNLPLSGPPVNGELSLQYDAANAQFLRVPDPLGEGPVSFDANLDRGGKTLTLLGGDLQVVLKGSPDNGDVLRLRANADGSGDNRNIQRIGQGMDQGLLEQGNLSLTDAWGSLISGVAVQAQATDASERSFSNLLSQAQTAREGVAGVNLDEEAADLLRFQQAYRASAQVITATESLFNTLLRAVGG